MEMRFYKDEDGWFADIPAYINAGGEVADLQMVEGADTMLDILSGNGKEVTLRIEEQPFDGSQLLKRELLCDPYEGAYYRMVNESFQLWLCGVTKWVFGSYPEFFYVKAI